MPSGRTHVQVPMSHRDIPLPPAAALTSAVPLHSHFTLLALLILRLPHSHPRAATMIVGSGARR